MRTFIAIELPDEIKAFLTDRIERLRATGAKASWVKPEAMHLTLRFLGDLDSDPVARIRKLLAEGYADVPAFTLKVAGMGAFPNRRRPGVVWAGVEPAEGTLAQAQAVAEQAALAIGLAPETKPFHPHLTLARVKDPAQGRILAEQVPWDEPFDTGSFPVTGVILFSSQLTPRGPIHERLQEYELR